MIDQILKPNPWISRIHTENDPPPETRKPTHADLKRMLLIAEALGVSAQAIRSQMTEALHVSHSSHLNLAQFNQLMAWVNSHIGRPR